MPYERAKAWAKFFRQNGTCLTVTQIQDTDNVDEVYQECLDALATGDTDGLGSAIRTVASDIELAIYDPYWLKENEQGYGVSLPKSEPKTLPGYVYLMWAETGVFKIGYSADPTRRLKQFDVLPISIQIICNIATADMVGLERSLHQQFASKRFKGEWLNLAAEDVEYIKSLAVES